MLEDLGWASLQSRRRTARLAMLYKIQHGIVSTEGLKSKLQLAPSRRRRAHAQQLVQPVGRTDYRKESFLPRTVRDWNTLSPTAVEADNVDTFVSRVSLH
ncbi:Hypp4515 [Branchiostoma lanceolatum]|uniref:Hypp4515 protein n=1 Tax=Branchiostoma lanceolatum TaxID=7740 RepID=A0A8K0A7V9_BRALA|nr:Hypp4515 [Branchiostoma lanceolatum]